MKQEVYPQFKEGLTKIVERLNQEHFQKGKFKLELEEKMDKESPKIGGELRDASITVKYKKHWYSQSTDTEIACFLSAGDNAIGYIPSSNQEYEIVIEKYLQEFSQQHNLEITGIRHMILD